VKVMVLGEDETPVDWPAWVLAEEHAPLELL
jgi:hypothetical protein